MSANNQIIIRRIDKRFFVEDVDVDTQHARPIHDAPYARLQHAIRAAKDYMQEHEVEYGLYIDDSAL